MTSRSRAATLLACLSALAFSAPGAANAAPADDAAARAAVDTFAFGDLVALERLEQVISARRAAAGSLGPALRSGSLSRRWAATYVAHALPRDAAGRRLLRERLRRDREPSIRALAGFALLGSGDSGAIRPLIALLEVRRTMPESDPPIPIARLVDDRLTLFTGQDFGFVAGDASAQRRAIARWKAWWQRVGKSIRYDRAERRYRTRARSKRATRSAAQRPPAVAAAAGRHVVRFDLQILFPPGTPSGTRRRVFDNIRDAQRFLNGPGRTGRCTPLEFRIDAQADVVGAELDDRRFPFYVDEDRTGGATWRTSFVNLGQGFGRLFTSQAVDPDLGSIIIAHELMHLLGLPDEYVRTPGSAHATSIDPTSFMGGVGEVLQRHLDAIAESQAPEDSSCERWSLLFRDWSSVIEPHTEERRSTTINHLGATARASIAASFWLDREGGEITPAGDRPCGRDLLPGAQSRPGGLTAPCKETGGNSVLTALRAAVGRARCPSARLEPLGLANRRFTTTVSGELRGEVLRLRLAPDAAERERLTAHCRPAAKPFRQSYQLVGNGMRFAGALAFELPATGGTRSFDRSGEHRRASGTVSVARVP